MNKKLNEFTNYDQFAAYITNLGKYNEGELVGKWVTFPCDEDEFEEILNGIQIDDEYEEWFVSDYEDEFGGAYEKFGEYPSYSDLNEYGEYYEKAHEEYDPDLVQAIIDNGSSLEEAVESLDNGRVHYFSNIDDEADLGIAYINEMYGDIETAIRAGLDATAYFDYEELGSDLGYDDYEDERGRDISAGEYWCGDEYATDREIGEAYVEEVGFDGVSDPGRYFDYEQLGEELVDDGYFISDGYAIIVD